MTEGSKFYEVSKGKEKKKYAYGQAKYNFSKLMKPKIEKEDIQVP